MFYKTTLPPVPEVYSLHPVNKSNCFNMNHYYKERFIKH